MPSFTYVHGNTCMSFNPKSHTSSPMTQPSSHITQAVLQSGSSRPIRQFLTSHVLNVNQAVPDLCSQYIIRQFFTSHVVNIQSSMQSSYSQCTHFHQCGTLTWASSIHPSPVLLGMQASMTVLVKSQQLLYGTGSFCRKINTWERKWQKKSVKCPCTKIEYFHQVPEYFCSSSAVPSLTCYTE